MRRLGLADAGRAEEDERADRSLRVLQAGTRAADGAGDRLDRVLLADDPVVQRRFHLQEPLGLLAGDAHQRDARPHRDDLRDVLFRDIRLVRLLLFLPLALHLVDAVAQALLAILQLLRHIEVVRILGGFLLALEGGEHALRLLQVRRRDGAVHPHARARLVDQVDRLVRQEPIRHVARGEIGGGLQRLVGDLQLVVLFVARRG